MVVCDNIRFIKTPEYEEVIKKLDSGNNVYLYGKSSTGKSTIARELQHELGKGLEFVRRYCYIEIPSRVESDTLSKIGEKIASQLSIEVGKNICGQVSKEDLFSALAKYSEHTLIVFDNIDNFANGLPYFKDDFVDFLHDLCTIEGYQVLCVGQDKFDSVLPLPLFFRNRSWRDMFNIIKVESINDVLSIQSIDIKEAMRQWMESQLQRGEYSESLLKIISMGITGKMLLGDAKRECKFVE